MTETHVYKLLTADDWKTACELGVTATGIDEADGYVHLSTRAQAAETARLHFSGKGPVRLLRFDIGDLPELTWEASRGGQMFPHLYAPLEVSLAEAVWLLVPDADGAPQMPEEY
ncbi:MAG: DUF952 domain-containing protein [Hyphomonas sp.]|uniref:DUF952 domain-containing protein n=1 Tax=Hyphomonas sp. TaxID=87 RepID=UPI0035296607